MKILIFQLCIAELLHTGMYDTSVHEEKNKSFY